MSGTVELPPTATNLQAAQRTLTAIMDEIKSGTFVYERHFSKVGQEAMQAASAATSFKDLAETWWTTVIADYGTKKGYRSTLDQVWIPALGDKAVINIRHSDIKAVIAQRVGAGISGKTVNNDLTSLRGILDAAVADGLIAVSPARLIKNLKHQKALPDPFTPEEVVRILADLKERAPVQVWAYFQFVLATGLRPSEMISVRWGKITWAEKTIRVDTAITRRREKGTKTSTIREVDLQAPAMTALAVMKPFTFLVEADAPIFCHPVTGEPWRDDQYQRKTYFHPCLKRLGIRKRDANQCRHTFATMSLMAGAKPAYIARQMGHKNSKMVHEVYAKWIDGADEGRERAKLEEAWANLVPTSIGPRLVPAVGDPH
jgi:integrase